MSRQDALSLFAPETAAWFRERVGEPTAVQTESWPLIHAGGHVLISAPTGTGKTLAAFLCLIDRLCALKRRGALRDELYAVYVSPLKALASDIRENLNKPLTGLKAHDIKTFVRTGDTTQAQRRAMFTHPPHILITTPESLYLILTTRAGRAFLSTARTVIIDEMHAMLSEKRGAHLSLSLARLSALCDHAVQRIGLSATINPFSEAARWLAPGEDVAVVAPDIEKKKSIRVLSAPEDMRVLPQNSIWPEIARTVAELSMTKRASIAFVEGRAQAEKLSLAVNALMGEHYSRTHHGSVSREARHETECAFREGRLKLLCATSSMELGIDVGYVDLVIQVGCPHTVSSALQRLGRAGHKPGLVSEMRIYPLTPMDALYCGLTADTALRGGIELARVPNLCLDVLAQHLVSMAANGDYTVDDALAIAHAAYPFQSVTRADVCALLAMLAGDYEHEQDHPVRGRVLYDRIGGVVRGDAYTRLLALSGVGVIPDRGMYPVYLPDGTRLGELDEEYVFEARLGDKFMLGAFAWRIDEIAKDRVVVSAGNAEGAQSPFWKGDGRGRDYKTSLEWGAKLRALSDAPNRAAREGLLKDLHMDAACQKALSASLERQIELTGGLPSDREIIVERLHDEAGEHQIMVHSIFGKRVNAGLSLLLCRQALLETKVDARAFEDDTGVLLYMLGVRAVPEGLLLRLSPDTAEELIERMLPATPLFSMRFRYNAACALMTGVKRLGTRQPLWVLRLRGAEVLSHVAGDRSHPLMRETLRECMEDDLDLPALRAVLSAVRSGDILVREIESASPSPMSLPFRRQVEATMMYDYSPIPQSAVEASLPGAAGVGARGFSLASSVPADQLVKPDAARLEQATLHVGAPQTADGLHARLMAEGDQRPDEEPDAAPWLDELQSLGRADYIEPGLWIAREERALYSAAQDGDEAARLRVTRRLARYRGGQSVESLAARYGWAEDECAGVLAALQNAGVLVRSDDVYYHAEVWRQASGALVRARRLEVVTCPPEAYAALCAGMLRAPGDAAQSLRAGLRTLLLEPQPAALLEDTLLPARTSGYRAAMLDELLAEGEVGWRVIPGDKLTVLLYDLCDEDAEGEWPSVGLEALSEAEAAALKLLRTRGASFASAVERAVPGGRALDALLSLCAKGLARADSFAPVRALLGQARERDAKRAAHMRARTLSQGRWEAVRPLNAGDMDTRLHRAFDACPLLCRETVRARAYAPSFSEAVTALRAWELTGRARRGYYVRGLSGVQFVRSADFDRVTARLRASGASVVWMNAADPLQPWGGVLRHVPGREFMRVPGTLCALRDGHVIAVLERRGEALRVFDESALDAALTALREAYDRRRVLTTQSGITLREVPPEAAEALARAGFRREMNDYVLYRGM